MEKHIKVHIFYIASILIGIIVILSTIRFGEIPKLVELISFALTITSLLLAILAIAYAVYSNTSFEKNISKLDNASDAISSSTSILSQITVAFEQKFQNIPFLLETIDKKTDSTALLLSQLSEKTFASENSVFIKSNDIEKESVKNVVNSSINGILILYALKLSKDNKQIFDIDMFGEVKVDYTQGFIQPLDSLGLIKRKTVEVLKKYEILDIHDEINNNIVDKVKELWDKNLNDSGMSFILENINSVRKYYGLTPNDITKNFY